MSSSDIVIIGASRTPLGRFLGALAPLSATELGAHAIKGAMAGIDPEVVDAVIMGQVLQAGVGQNPAKQAALGAGISPRAHTATVNKVCLSGLTAVIDAARLLRSGEASVVVAGGMESMSNAPHLLPGSRSGTRYGTITMVDHLAFDGLTAADLGISMGELSEQYAQRYPATRLEQDQIAAASHGRAHQAWVDGVMGAEVTAVTITSRRGEVVVDRDEGIREGTTLDVLAGLRPAFTAGGSITAGNSSPLSDGAAATILTTRARAHQEGWEIFATLGAPGQVAGPDPSLQEQPASALSIALERQGWTAGSLGMVEINEAFAAVSVCSARALGVDPDKVNPHGGAIALGHPIGASGARLVVHAAHRIRAGKVDRAGVALCGGGGQGEALLLGGADGLG